MYARRFSLPAVLSAFLLVMAGLFATPAHADVDIELIGETLSQEGYYVDSGSKAFRSDEALDRLRNELESGLKQPVFVTVLPAGASGPGLSAQLSRQVGRSGTYAVMIGSQLEATSTVVPQRTVRSFVRRALSAGQGDPEGALIQFTRLLKERESGRSPQNKSKDKSEKPEEPTPTPTETVQTQAAPPPPEESGPDPLLIGGLVAAAILLAGGALFWWRRRGGRTAEDAAIATGYATHEPPSAPLPPLPSREPGGPTPGAGAGSGGTAGTGLDTDSGFGSGPGDGSGSGSGSGPDAGPGGAGPASGPAGPYGPPPSD